MAGIDIKNLPLIRSATEWSADLGAKLAEALQDIALQASNGQQQTNANPTGQPQPPPPVQGISVSAQNGYMHVAIKDQSPIYRGVRYYVEHADNPQFTNPQIVALHDVRNVTIPVGNQKRYVRAYSAYSSSEPNAPIYHGSSVEPIAVAGGGAHDGPAFLPSQGSGTGPAGAGLQGPGKEPFRPVAGKPPIR